MYTNIFSVPPSDNFPVCELGSDHSQTEDEMAQLVCKSKGAVPTATLRWFNGTSDQLIVEGQQETNANLTFKASRFDHDKPFYCTAENKATQILRTTPRCTMHIGVWCESARSFILLSVDFL